MKQYTANEIIDKAYQLLDLQNSAFIEHSEALSLLNDEYSSLYTKTINKLEQLFLSRVTLNTPDSTEKYNNTTLYEYNLPTDFFQLRAVYNLKDSSLIKRKPVSNFAPHDVCYDIVNDQLVIYTTSPDANKGIIMEYYKVPETITAPDPDDETDTTVDYVFSYPSSMFYVILAYKLAQSFLQKQGAPTTFIDSKLQDVEASFYNQLGRDANQQIRISNVYGINNYLY